VKCRLCESPVRLYAERMYTLDGVDFDLVKCTGCGVVFVDPFPDQQRVSELYDDAYFQRDYSFGIVEGDYLASEVVRESEYRRILSRIARLTAGRNLLEVGCAAGAFLKEARAQGWNAVGVDISQWAVKTARDRFGLDVRHGTLAEQGFASSSFDAVFFGDLIEHLTDPVGFLKEVKRVLKPRDSGGVAAAKVPTYVNSFYYRWLRKAAGFTGLGHRSGALLQILKLSDTGPRMPPYHLFEFNPSCVRWIFGRAGLEVIEENQTLMIPEFLQTNPAGWARFMFVSFSALRFFIESFGIPGGHAVVFAASTSKESDR